MRKLYPIFVSSSERILFFAYSIEMSKNAYTMYENAIEILKSLNWYKDRYKICAIVYKHHSIISIGLASKDHIEHITPSTHAEVNAFEKIRGNVRNVDIVVARIGTGKNKTRLRCKPCYHCVKFLKEKSIRRISYFNGEQFITERLNTLSTDHISKGWKSRINRTYVE